MTGYRGRLLGKCAICAGLLVALFGMPSIAAEPGEVPVHLPLQPVHRFKIKEGKQRFDTLNALALERHRADVEKIAFLAVVTNRWPAGLVPIFAVDKADRFELRRLPPKGQENFSDPLFFALPPEGDRESTMIAGSWDVRATRGDNTEDYFGWDLAADLASVGGRFDPFTDFRFAYITRGSFTSNRLDLRVEYLMEAYLLEGRYRDDELQGQWRREDEGERGTWRASRRRPPLPPASDSVALYEWRAAEGPERRYLVDGEEPGAGWIRAEKPLGSVWPVAR